MTLLIENDKRALRADFRARRKNMSREARFRAASGFLTQLVSLVAQYNAHTVSCFVPTDAEPDTRPFLEWAREQGIRVLLPISRDDGQLDWSLATGSGSGLRAGRYGIEEPTGPRLGPDAVGTVDLMIIPAAAADTQGTRLGWGRGYFDKTLAALAPTPPVFAVVFDSEFVSVLPRDVHDQPINGVVTPTRTVMLPLTDQ